MNKKDPFSLTSKIIFFFNVFLAIIIIIGSDMLIKTKFGKASLVFGFIMLILSIFLRIIKKW